MNNMTIKVKDLAAAINAAGEAGNETKLYPVCWDCNLGGVFDIPAKSEEEAREIMIQRIESGEYTTADLETCEERVYIYGKEA